jgi:nucleosome binding factor SPN SPT16 subunit
MRKLNRVIAAGALAVPMALGVAGVAGAAVEGSEGQDPLGGLLDSGGSSDEASSDEASSDEASSDEASSDEASSDQQAGRDARQSGSDLRTDLLKSGSELQDSTDTTESTQESGNSSEGADNLSGVLEALDLGGSNFENVGSNPVDPSS